MVKPGSRPAGHFFVCMFTGYNKKKQFRLCCDSIETELPLCVLAFADTAIRYVRTCGYGWSPSTNKTSGTRAPLSVRLALDHVP